MATNTVRAPRELIGFLDYYLVGRSPVQLPGNVKDWIVRYGPWITVALLLLALPPLLFAFGIGATLVPFGGLGYATGFTVSAAAALVVLGLMIAALPGLFARNISGWRLLFYAAIANVVFSLLAGAIVSAVIGGVISFFILFQVRRLYHE
jgi:hypothetical protein